MQPVSPTFFPTQSDFRAWLEENHDTAAELWVGFYKKSSGFPSITWPQSVDEALCFGWIDGVRKSIDDASYMIRFTPRKENSTWSAVNLRRVEELTQLGLMNPAGLKAFARRKENNSKIYSYEQEPGTLTPDYEQKLQSNSKAWAFFQTLPPYVKKTTIHWVMSAKQEETRLRRLDTLIQSSEEGKRVPPLRIAGKDRGG